MMPSLGSWSKDSAHYVCMLIGNMVEVRIGPQAQYQLTPLKMGCI